jgi:hypothetical protein
MREGDERRRFPEVGFVGQYFECLIVVDTNLEGPRTDIYRAHYFLHHMN